MRGPDRLPELRLQCHVEGTMCPATATVKTYAISIYRKLGVASRSEAVERTRELGLL